MNEPQFIIKVKQFLNHKLILHAVFNIRDKFGTFLKFPNHYSTAQIAILIKRHENLLEIVLPIPQNPTYTTSLAALQTILHQAEQIIKIYNL
jgi:hypothetical protein